MAAIDTLQTVAARETSRMKGDSSKTVPLSRVVCWKHFLSGLPMCVHLFVVESKLLAILYFMFALFPHDAYNFCKNQIQN